VGDEVLYILWWCAYWGCIAHLVNIISLLPVNLAMTVAILSIFWTGNWLLGSRPKPL